MNEAERVWLTTNDHPRDLIEMVEGNPFTPPLERRWRLFLCAWGRRVAHLAETPLTYALIATAEQYADGAVSTTAVEQIWFSAREAMPGDENSRARNAFYAALVTGFRSGSQHIFDYAYYGLGHAASASGDKEAEWIAQAAIVKDIFGNPFRPSPPLPPAVLAWNDGTVRRIAEAIYQDRKMPEGTLDPGRLAILADALLDAGCCDEELIRHCRQPGPHVRGCWAVDLLLGKE